MEGENLCQLILKDILSSVVENSQSAPLGAAIKPKFHAKRPPKPSTVNPANVSRLDGQQHRQKMEAMASSLGFITSDRDQWRQKCDEARRLAEGLAGDNNRLTMACGEMEARVEDQSRVCTTLASHLVEIIWSLTGTPGSDLISPGELHTLRLCQVTAQALEHNTEAELKLLTGLMGCLVNLSGSPTSLKVFVGEEEGRALVAGVAAKIIDYWSLKQPGLLDLGMMFMSNILGCQPLCSMAPLLCRDTLARLEMAAGKWGASDRAGKNLRAVAGGLCKVTAKLLYNLNLDREQ